jgi:ABC-type nitrate/sulfonate/bicarbonate transport system substrate-binding protein
MISAKKAFNLGMAVLLLIGAVVQVGCKAGHTETKRLANGLFPLKTKTMKDCSLAPWLVAERNGYFADEGIQIVHTGETQEPLMIPSVLSGDNDVWGGHPNTIAVAKAGGARITGVMRGGIDPPASVDPRFRHMFWFVNPQKYPNVKTFGDLKNIPGQLKFSTITTNVCADFLANKMADKNGISRDKFEWVTMPDIQAIQALKQGLIDVAGVHPPFYKGMADSGAVKIADSVDTGLGAAAGVGYTYFSDSFIQQHPEIVKGFIRAMFRAGAWLNANPEKGSQWVSEVIGVPVTGNHYYATQNVIMESELVPWIQDLEDHHVIPRGKIKPSDLVTHQFETHEEFALKK